MPAVKMQYISSDTSAACFDLHVFNTCGINETVVSVAAIYPMVSGFIGFNKMG